jgi:pilus assembly protein CpaB
MPEGVVIDRQSVAVAQWPAGTQPAGSYASVDSVANRVTRVPVFKGEAMVPARLALQSAGPGLEVKITPGKRAYAVRINDVASVAGMIQPNSRVDVMAIIDDPNQHRQVAKLFLEEVRVLAVGTATEGLQSESPTHTAVVSLEVTPEQAERLAVAAAQGELQLVLRGYGDPDLAPRGPRDRMPMIIRRTACDPPAGQPIVRDLLLRGACSQELRFKKDSAGAVAVPRR